MQGAEIQKWIKQTRAKKNKTNKKEKETSLAVQWLWLRTPNAEGVGSIPGGKIKIPHACCMLWHPLLN